MKHWVKKSSGSDLISDLIYSDHSGSQGDHRLYCINSTADIFIIGIRIQRAVPPGVLNENKLLQTDSIINVICC